MERRETAEEGCVSSGAGMDLFKWHGLSRSQRVEHRRDVELPENCYSRAAMERSCRWGPQQTRQRAQERKASLS